MIFYYVDKDFLIESILGQVCFHAILEVMSKRFLNACHASPWMLGFDVQ
jgi:hypothetical protein